MNKLMIIGAGGHGRSVESVAKRMNKWTEIQFLDDHEEGMSVLGEIKQFPNYEDEYEFIIALGDNETRSVIQKGLVSHGVSIATIIDPTAIIDETVEIGQGSVVMPGVIINVNTKIGEGAIINTGSIIDHDGALGDFCHISPNCSIAGEVTIGDDTWVGIGSTIINDISIESNTVIGAGSVVIANLEKGTYAGVPVRKVHG